ncbi:MAG: hypothetical protein WAL98_04455 [Desulfatiglandaceae bacterium]|jgi:transketolase N-terminal domain/subunit
MATDATPGVKIQRGILHQENETMIDQAQLDRLCINAIRTLSIDAIQKANSGHPVTPMGAAPTVYCLWQRFLRYDPEDVNWANRDRFVLSNGHEVVIIENDKARIDALSEEMDCSFLQGDGNLSRRRRGRRMRLRRKTNS